MVAASCWGKSKSPCGMPQVSLAAPHASALIAGLVGHPHPSLPKQNAAIRMAPWPVADQKDFTPPGTASQIPCAPGLSTEPAGQQSERERIVPLLSCDGWGVPRCNPEASQTWQSQDLGTSQGNWEVHEPVQNISLHPPMSLSPAVLAVLPTLTHVFALQMQYTQQRSGLQE